MRRIMGLALGLTLAASAQAELLITDFLVETKVLGKSTDPDGELRPYIPIVSYIPNSGYTRRAMDRSDDNRLGLPWDRTPGHPPFSPAKPKAPKLPVFARSAEFFGGCPRIAPRFDGGACRQHDTAAKAARDSGFDLWDGRQPRRRLSFDCQYSGLHRSTHRDWSSVAPVTASGRSGNATRRVAVPVLTPPSAGQNSPRAVAVVDLDYLLRRRAATSATTPAAARPSVAGSGTDRGLLGRGGTALASELPATETRNMAAVRTRP